MSLPGTAAGGFVPAAGAGVVAAGLVPAGAVAAGLVPAGAVAAGFVAGAAVGFAGVVAAGFAGVVAAGFVGVVAGAGLAFAGAGFAVVGGGGGGAAWALPSAKTSAMTEAAPPHPHDRDPLRPTRFELRTGTPTKVPSPPRLHHLGVKIRGRVGGPIVGRSMEVSEVGRGVEAERGQTAFFGAMTVDCPRAPVLRPLVLGACFLVIGAAAGGCDRGRSGSITTPDEGATTVARVEVAQPANDGAVAKASVVADAPACGALTAMGRSKPLPLLADRLRVRSVKGAEDNPVPWDVMGAPDAATDRSRIYVENGEHGLAIVGSEMYQRAGRDFVAQAAKELAMPGGEVMQVDTGNAGLVLVAWLPTEAPQVAGDTAFLLRGLLAHTDVTIQMIESGTFPHEVTSIPG